MDRVVHLAAEVIQDLEVVLDLAREADLEAAAEANSLKFSNFLTKIFFNFFAKISISDHIKSKKFFKLSRSRSRSRSGGDRKSRSRSRSKSRGSRKDSRSRSRSR